MPGWPPQVSIRRKSNQPIRQASFDFVTLIETWWCLLNRDALEGGTAVFRSRRFRAPAEMWEPVFGPTGAT